TSNSIGMRLVPIPAGKFIMGSPPSEPGRRSTDEAQHEITISKPFFMGAYEGKIEQFRGFVGATGYKTPAEKKGTGSDRSVPGKGFQMDPQCTWQNPGWRASDDHPVTCVTWNDAVAFCDWLSKKENALYRLPTEAEWEYACRAGTTTPYHCGATIASPQ